MHELQHLLEQDPDSLTSQTKNVRPNKHIIFSGFFDTESVTIPICGDISNPLATRKIPRVTCKNCLIRLKEISEMETHQEALNYIATFAPVFQDPDLSVIEDKIGREPTLAAKEAMERRFILQNYNLDAAADAPKAMIGPSKNAYYYNMIEFEIFNRDGTKNQETLDMIQAQIDSLDSP